MTSDLLPISLADMRAEIERELAMRAQVYPRRVAARRMTEQLADRRIAVLQAVATLLAEPREPTGFAASLNMTETGPP